MVKQKWPTNCKPKARWWICTCEINEYRTWHLVRFYKVEYVWPQTWPAWKHALFICLINPNLMSWYGFCFQASISRQHSSIWTTCLTSRSYMITTKCSKISISFPSISSLCIRKQQNTSVTASYKCHACLPGILLS